MKNYLIGAVIALFVWLGVALWFLIHTKKELDWQIRYSMMIIQDYAENVRYSICVENIAYWQHRDYKKCENLSKEPLEDLDYYYENFPLFFKNMQ